MKAPAFWWDPSPTRVARLLSPLGHLFGAVTARRMGQPGAAAPIPVVCIGNLTAGGAGKTPVALALGRLLQETGEHPAFVSRGYGGHHRGPPHRVRPGQDAATLVGDEPLLLARCAPTVVSADRVAGVAACAAAGASLAILDDGLQNPSLRKTLTLAVVDGGSGFGNGLCLPAGPLRAPVAAQWPFVDAVILVGDGAAGQRVEAAARARGKPVFHASLQPVPEARELAGRRVFAFAGIGRPAKFYDSLRTLGAELAGTRDFADHHPYSMQDMVRIEAEARRLGAVPVTTEKDWVRLPQCEGIAMLHVELAFAEPQALLDLVLAAVRG